jgi:L-amino acid N-acyltransferase YncA
MIEDLLSNYIIGVDPMLIRQATISDASAIAKVHVDSWRSTYCGIVPAEYLDSLSYEDRTKRWQQTFELGKAVFVAEDEAGNIVGFANGGVERSGDPVYKGELYAIYLLKPFQGRGLGRQLVQAVLKDLEKSNLRSFLIWVLEENPSKYFYEKLGGREVKQQGIEIGGVTLQEIAYGWEELKDLR